MQFKCVAQFIRTCVHKLIPRITAANLQPCPSDCILLYRRRRKRRRRRMRIRRRYDLCHRVRLKYAYLLLPRNIYSFCHRYRYGDRSRGKILCLCNRKRSKQGNVLFQLFKSKLQAIKQKLMLVCPRQERFLLRYHQTPYKMWWEH